VGKGIYCHDLLANLQKKISTVCLAQLLEGCKNPHANEQVLKLKRLCRSPLNKIIPVVGCPLSKSVLTAAMHV